MDLESFNCIEKNDFNIPKYTAAVVWYSKVTVYKLLYMFIEHIFLNRKTFPRILTFWEKKITVISILERLIGNLLP